MSPKFKKSNLGDADCQIQKLNSPDSVWRIQNLTIHLKIYAPIA